MLPPTRQTAERHTHALQSRAATKPAAAAQSQIGRACSSPANARRTSEPRSCGVAATASSATQTIPATASVRGPRCDRSLSCAKFIEIPRPGTAQRPAEMRRYARPMRGAIAAGHRITAETGARVLAAGGNAVDACVAAAFASWVAESTLTGPGRGGFMLVHRARDRGARLLDFFVAVPGRGLPPHERAAMQQVDVDFDRATSQVFHIGAPSIAVPGTPAGLEVAHRTYGSLPWPELVAPAVELARDGIELTRPQAYLHAILDLILRHTDEGRRIYERNGERLIAGDRLTMPDLANTPERIA